MARLVLTTAGMMQNEQWQCPLPWSIVEYVDVAARARELGCRVPSRLALLPGNFATAASAADFRFHEVAAQVRSAWRSIGLVDTGPYRVAGSGIADPFDSSDGKVPLAVFFGAGLLSVPARPVLHAIGIVASILLDDPSSASARELRFSAVVERPRGRGYACLEYQGDACELVALARSVRAIWDGDAVHPVASDFANVRCNPANNRFVRARDEGFVESEPPTASRQRSFVANVLVTR